MSKKIFLILLLVTVIFRISVVNLYAGAYEWGGLGTRAQAMGGAFIGLADDWTALYWNPAGLAQLKFSEWGIEFFCPTPVLKDANSLSNLLPAQMDTKFQIDTFAQYTGLEPTRFNKERVDYNFFLPNGFGASWKGKEFVFAVGYYTPVSYYFDWEDTISYGAGSINAKLFQKLVLNCFNFSLAKEINKKLFVGAGLGLLYGSIDYSAEKTVANSGISDYAWDFESFCDGFDAEGIFGLLYKISDTFSLGGVYRSGSAIKLKGNADTTLSLTSLNESSDFKQRFRVPSTWGIGLSYAPSKKVTLTCDFQRTNWSKFKTYITYDKQGSALTNKDYSMEWEDSNRYRLGAEYKLSDSVVLRGGYFFDEASLQDKSVSFSDIPDVDRHNGIIGIGWKLKNNWCLDFNYAFAYGERTINDVTYLQKVNSLGLTINKKF